MTFDETGKRPDLESYKVVLPVFDTPADKPPADIDPKLLQRPLKVLRAIVAGNGITPEQVTLGDHQIKTMPFAGSTIIKVTAKTTKEQVPGREIKGEIMPDEQAMFGAIHTYIKHVISTEPLRQKILGIVLNRPDKGFAIDNKKLDFKTLTKRYVVYRACLKCNKSGKVLCPACEGRKQIKCTVCNGLSHVVCPTCQSRGTISDHGSERACPTCHRKGRIPCHLCGGDGLNACKLCLATGQINCKTCAHTGWTSLTVLAELQAHYNFVFDRRDLPTDAIQIMVELGSKLIDRSIAEIEIAGTRTYVEDRQLPEDQIVLLYKGRMPFGPVAFDLNGHTIGASLYGYHGDLTQCPDFMEQLGKDNIERLVVAAEQPRQAGALLKVAGKARFLREALQAGLMGNRAKALALYKTRYPYGFSTTMIRDLLTLADTATRNASRDFRVYGLIGSQALVILLQTAYYLGPGLALMGLYVGNIWGQIALDLALTLIFMAVAFFLPRLAGAVALRQRLGDVLKSSTFSALIPRAGKLEWMAVTLVPLTTAALIYMAKINGGVTPAWLHLVGL